MVERSKDNILYYFMILSSFKIEAGPEPIESIIK